MSRTANKPATKSSEPTVVHLKSARRPVIGLEQVMSLAPNERLAAKLSQIFGIEPVDYDTIRDDIEAQFKAQGETLKGALNDRALQIDMQRLVGARVASAHAAAQFYGAKLTTARDLTSRLANEERDEDRGGPSGFESKADRARYFAAEMGLQAYALLAAAEGAVQAYADVTGDAWKPYVPPQPAAVSVSRRSAAEEMSAFQAE